MDYEIYDVVKYLRVYATFKEYVNCVRSSEGHVEAPIETFARRACRTALHELPIEIMQHMPEFQSDLEYLISKGIVDFRE